MTIDSGERSTGRRLPRRTGPDKVTRRRRRRAADRENGTGGRAPGAARSSPAESARPLLSTPPARGGRRAALSGCPTDGRRPGGCLRRSRILAPCGLERYRPRPLCRGAEGVGQAGTILEDDPRVELVGQPIQSLEQPGDGVGEEFEIVNDDDGAA